MAGDNSDGSLAGVFDGEVFRILFENAADGILLMSADGEALASNEAFARMHGYTREEIGRMRLADLDTPKTAEEAPERLARLLERRTLTFEVEHFHKDGHAFPLSVTCNVVEVGGRLFFQGFHQDITQRRREEEILGNAQRLESLGVLAGGIAHDFNNLLMGILGNVDLAALVSEGPALGFLEQIRKGVERGAALSAQLLTFSKGGEPRMAVGRLQPCVRSTAEFALCGSNVSCRFDLPDDLWTSRFDWNQVSQVVENLVLNAAQAMPGGGTVTISAANASLGPGEAPPLPGGNYVRITVADAGAGIPPEHLDRIFDPFFTTKEAGTGLGLSVSFSIVKKHGGHISAESAPGEGSAFHVLLPASHEAVEEPAEAAPAIPRGEGRILVMDDAEAIRIALGRGLEGAGYTVIAARDGREALEEFRSGLRQGRPFRAAILDLTIPGGMGGRDAARGMRELDRAVPLIAASGYSDDPAIAHPGEFGFAASIRKPFALSELVGLLHRHLHDVPTT